MENPKAEYGWKPGAVVNVGIKSGTNQLHGSAYAFYRSSALGTPATAFNFAPDGVESALQPLPSACDKLAAQLKQFGGVVGGPIIKDKLFFFGGYEGLRSFIGHVFGTTGGAAFRKPECRRRVSWMLANCWLPPQRRAGWGQLQRSAP